MWQNVKKFVLGEATTGDLPQRVLLAIEARQQQGELLIAATQLAIGLMWAGLYALAPKTFAADMTFAPVPVALAVYLAFSAVRLYAVKRGFTPRWFLATSVVIDMAVLLGLIWSFHLQYQQPAAFYLKAPTMLYLFIFIALRALRFSAAYVLLAGVTAAVGWLVLLAYAFYSSSAPNMGVTRDYIAYLTSNMILIGAEFDKIIAILLTTGIIAIAIHRARGLLVTAVREGLAHDELNRFFDPAVARQITNADRPLEPGQGVVRQAAILFCDIRGFTSRAKTMPPADLMALLGGYQKRMIEVIERHGGAIDKFLGDGILATFGATSPSTRAAADVLRAIKELDHVAKAWAEERQASGQQPVEIGFAADYGDLVFGAVGDDSRLEVTVIGDPVNRAAKLEAANKVQNTSALISKATYDAALAQGFVANRTSRQCPAINVAGLSEVIDLVVLCEK